MRIRIGFIYENVILWQKLYDMCIKCHIIDLIFDGYHHKYYIVAQIAGYISNNSIYCNRENAKVKVDLSVLVNIAQEHTSKQ